jgi:hypothetical protein
MSVKDRRALSRRTVLMAAAGAAPLLVVGRAEAAGLPKTAVGYQDHPNEDKQCSECNFFVAPNSCKSVAGEISPNGYCKLFAKKPA